MRTEEYSGGARGKVQYTFCKEVQIRSDSKSSLWCESKKKRGLRVDRVEQGFLHLRGRGGGRGGFVAGAEARGDVGGAGQHHGAHEEHVLVGLGRRLGARVQPEEAAARDQVHRHPEPVDDVGPELLGHHLAAQRADRRVVHAHADLQKDERAQRDEWRPGRVRAHQRAAQRQPARRQQHALRFHLRTFTLQTY